MTAILYTLVLCALIAFATRATLRTGTGQSPPLRFDVPGRWLNRAEWRAELKRIGLLPR